MASSLSKGAKCGVVVSEPAAVSEMVSDPVMSLRFSSPRPDDNGSLMVLAIGKVKIRRNVSSRPFG